MKRIRKKYDAQIPQHPGGVLKSVQVELPVERETVRCHEELVDCYEALPQLTWHDINIIT